ncbi:MAG TPA: sulfotransferase [Blastocatellia bacterium]|nr:sulfotransferase [Blastocatellia bacterium]HMV85475.1 sulfotransferase [Blastocatellia bacterium]HMX26641.1 sulfotransferase [Blastocatellia bacterium]HMZ20897.1 sulfotransferase [Blastocatellia bacterium]HNG34553.1 sulfotransferase [Blastocatellia bacterium]
MRSNPLAGKSNRSVPLPAQAKETCFTQSDTGFFIIFGCPRSGTTLLAQCLSAHSKVFVPYETDIFIPCAFIMSRVSNLEIGKNMIADLITNAYSFDLSLGKYLSVEEVRQSVTQSEYTLSTIFKNLFALVGEKVGKPIVGDKSPNDMFDILALAQAGMLKEPVKVIHIVRDLRDAITSLNRQNWVDNADVWFPRLWSDRNLFLQAHLRQAPNYFFLRYEDFVANPTKWLQSLTSFLNIEFEPHMLNTASFPEYYKTVPAHRHLHDPIGTQRIGLWKKQAAGQKILIYEAQAREALLNFGYLQASAEEGARRNTQTCRSLRTTIQGVQR